MCIRDRGIRCAVASNKDDNHVQILSEKLFHGLFDISIGRNPEMAIKPDRRVYICQPGAVMYDARLIGQNGSRKNRQGEMCIRDRR